MPTETDFPGAEAPHAGLISGRELLALSILMALSGAGIVLLGDAVLAAALSWWGPQ